MRSSSATLSAMAVSSPSPLFLFVAIAEVGLRLRGGCGWLRRGQGCERGELRPIQFRREVSKKTNGVGVKNSPSSLGLDQERITTAISSSTNIQHLLCFPHLYASLSLHTFAIAFHHTYTTSSLRLFVSSSLYLFTSPCPPSSPLHIFTSYCPSTLIKTVRNHEPAIWFGRTDVQIGHT
jgi:hypothetical protein